jgi:N-methylhydantoinase B
VDYETVAGALGARPYRDGTDAVRVHASGAANLPVESLELAYPLQVVRYELVRDGGGAGAFRGGLPVRRDTRILAQDATLSSTGDRLKHPAPGLGGGLAGAPGAFLLNPDSSAELTVPGVTAGLQVAVDDVVSVRTPGGGGYGDPLDRDPHKVADDLQDDRISAQAAEQVYGAVIRQGRLDEAATERLRSRLRGKAMRSEE